MLPYIENPTDRAARLVFESGTRAVGFDALPEDATQRGINELMEYAQDLVLTAIVEGLALAEPEQDRDAVRRTVLNAYVSGRQAINPLDIPVQSSRGRSRWAISEKAVLKT